MKKFFIVILVLALSLIGYGQTTYYVSNGGDDGANGTSTGTSWETIAKVNAASLNPGDSILFNRGDTWREILVPETGSSENDIYYGAYGTGAKPLFLGSVQANDTGDWADQGGNIWQNSDAAFTVDVGNLIFNDEESCGVKIMDASPTLDAQGEFWYDFDNDRIRMYSVGNPATFYTNIECALRYNALDTYGDDYITYQNLDFRYWAAHVWEGYGNYISFLDVDMSYIGGADGGLTEYETRYGNGLQMWEGEAHDVLITRCRIDNVYDAGISPQGYASGYTSYNIYMWNNIITNCEYGFEYFHRTGSTTHDIYFENNTIVNAGGGFGHNQRPDVQAGYCIRFGAWTGTQGDNINIRNNILFNATEALFAINRISHITNITIDYNLYYQESGNYGYQEYDEIDYVTFANWQTAISQEANAVDGDPLFVSSMDFNLQVGSPAINEGVANGLATDFAGNLRSGLPDMGAYEYVLDRVPLKSGSVFLKSNGKLMY